VDSYYKAVNSFRINFNVIFRLVFLPDEKQRSNFRRFSLTFLLSSDCCMTPYFNNKKSDTSFKWICYKTAKIFFGNFIYLWNFD